MAMTKRNLVEVKWTKDDQGRVVEGVLLRIETVNYSDGPGLRYLVRSTRPGEMISFPGTAGLNRRLEAGDIGRRISVAFLGFEAESKTAPGMSPQKLFEVLVDEDGLVSQPHPNGVALDDGAPAYNGPF